MSPAANSNPNHIHILIVEDSPTQAELLKHVLESRHYSVFAARNGAEALALISQRKPTLVISDIIMPELNGYELCRRIKANPQWSDIPVILVTALSEPQDVIAALDCGADNFIRKPYDGKYLVSRIEYLLANHRLREQHGMELGLEIHLGGRKHHISAERQQIVDLLISTYDEAIGLNQALRLRERELDRAVRSLDVLYRVAKGLNQAATEAQVVEEVLARVTDFPDVQAAWLVLLEGPRTFRLAGSRSLPPALAASLLASDDCLCWRQLLSGELNGVTNTLECERLQNPAGDTGGLTCHASVPLQIGGRALGILNLAGPAPGRFQEEDLHNLNGIGNQVAVALERVRLHQDLEQRVEERTTALQAENEQRKRSETELRQSQASLRELATLIELSHDAIVIMDLEGRITFANRGATALYGWTVDEMKDRRVPEFLYSKPEPFESARRALLEKGEWHGDQELVTKSGQTVLVASRWTLLRDSEHQGRSVLTISTDITEKRRLEAQALRGQRLESIGTLAGGIAHDLNNILAPILMSLQILRDRLGPSAGDDRRLLDTLETSAQRGAEMVKQVLTFARGAEGDRVAVQVGYLIKDVVNILKQTIPKSVTIQAIRSKTLDTVRADPTQINQILMNLCVNARDAMPQGGRLTISAENVAVDAAYASMNPEAKPGRYVLLTVADTGTGIPPGILEHIFDPFFTTKPPGVGTGLGLATVRGIVRGHGGFIHVYSEPGKGSQFKVYLPAETAAPAPSAAQAQQPALPMGHGETILVVDDEAAIRDIARLTLNAFGYQALTAGHGAEAVALCAQHKGVIKLMVTDMAMPVMDGPATISAVQTLDPTIKIIATSGLGSAPALDAGVRAAAFLRKPYTGDALIRAVQAALQ